MLVRMYTHLRICNFHDEVLRFPGSSYVIFSSPSLPETECDRGSGNGLASFRARASRGYSTVSWSMGLPIIHLARYPAFGAKVAEAEMALSAPREHCRVSADHSVLKLF